MSEGIFGLFATFMMLIKITAISDWYENTSTWLVPKLSCCHFLKIAISAFLSRTIMTRLTTRLNAATATSSQSMKLMMFLENRMLLKLGFEQFRIPRREAHLLFQSTFFPVKQ